MAPILVDLARSDLSLPEGIRFRITMNTLPRGVSPDEALLGKKDDIPFTS